jgi:putative DNA primase/helicase
VYEAILLILYGTGANGKSTFTEALRPVFGEFAYRTNTDTLMVTGKGGNSATPDIANLRGTRFVTASESEETATLAESLIKDLTGNDMISGRHLYADPIEFAPSHTLWLSTNHKPLIKGTDNGIWRRVKLVPFNKAIPKKEQDTKLLDKLKYESSGILNWVIAGALRYEAEGLVEPDVVKRQTEAYRYDLDRLAQFIEEECAVDYHFTTPLGAFYKAYESWVLAAGSREKPEGKQHFGQKLESKGYRKDRSHGVHIWRGIKLKDAGEIPAPTL